MPPNVYNVDPPLVIVLVPRLVYVGATKRAFLNKPNPIKTNMPVKSRNFMGPQTYMVKYKYKVIYIDAVSQNKEQI